MNKFISNDKIWNPTPYQGRKRCFGEYSCQNCSNSWKSANSKANIPQVCTKCNTLVLASKQSSLNNKFIELRQKKDVKKAYLNELMKLSQPKQ